MNGDVTAAIERLRKWSDNVMASVYSKNNTTQYADFQQQSVNDTRAVLAEVERQREINRRLNRTIADLDPEVERLRSERDSERDVFRTTIENEARRLREVSEQRDQARAEREALAALAWSRGVATILSGRDDTSATTFSSLSTRDGTFPNPYLTADAEATQ